MNFGGSLRHAAQLMGSMFSKVAGLGMTYVPYKGGAPSLADLMTAVCTCSSTRSPCCSR